MGDKEILALLYQASHDAFDMHRAMNNTWRNLYVIQSGVDHVLEDGKMTEAYCEAVMDGDGGVAIRLADKLLSCVHDVQIRIDAIMEDRETVTRFNIIHPIDAAVRALEGRVGEERTP
jgi:hypothetical protein